MVHMRKSHENWVCEPKTVKNGYSQLFCVTFNIERIMCRSRWQINLFCLCEGTKRSFGHLWVVIVC